MTFIAKLADGKDYILDGVFTGTLTLVAPPPPDPNPDKLPVLVPEFAPVSLPAAARIVTVGTQAALDGAISSAKPGDRIVLAAGNYLTLNVGKQIGTPEHPLVFVGTPGATVGHGQFLNSNYIHVYGLDYYGGIEINNSYGITMACCNIHSKTNGTVITNTKGGNFRFINNRYTYEGPEANKFTGLRPAAWWSFGKDSLISNCLFLGSWRDGISCGETLMVGPNENLLIRKCWFGGMIDDAIEADGAHVNSIIEDCIIGGTKYKMAAGISMAPVGAGGLIVRRCSISGNNGRPFKFNSDNNFSENVALLENTLVAVPDSPSSILWLQSPPTTLTKNVLVKGNTFIARGAIFNLDHTLIGNMVWEGNRHYSTGLTGGYLFAKFNGTTGNDQAKDFATWQSWGNDVNGAFVQTTATPVPIWDPVAKANFPIEQLCGWKIG